MSRVIHEYPITFRDLRTTIIRRVWADSEILSIQPLVNADRWISLVVLTDNTNQSSALEDIWEISRYRMEEPITQERSQYIGTIIPFHYFAVKLDADHQNP